jgi:hypothetical protein
MKGAPYGCVPDEWSIMDHLRDPNVLYLGRLCLSKSLV